MPTNLDLKLLKGQELGKISIDVWIARAARAVPSCLAEIRDAEMMHDGQSGEREKLVAPFSMTARHVKRHTWMANNCNFAKKSWKTCSDQNPPKQSPETRNRLKDDDPFPWRNAFWGALFTMAQAALACQIAPALDTDEDSSSLHFRAWHKGSSESHRRESSKIGPSKKLHRWLRKNIAWNCLEMSLVNIKKKLRGFASSLQLGAPGRVLEKGESPPNEDSMDFFHFSRVLVIFGTGLILMVLQSCWLN